MDAKMLHEDNIDDPPKDYEDIHEEEILADTGDIDDMDVGESGDESGDSIEIESDEEETDEDNAGNAGNKSLSSNSVNTQSNLLSMVQTEKASPESSSFKKTDDKILFKIFRIMKPICESVDIFCEWKRSNYYQLRFIQVFNPKADKYFKFFPTLNLIIYVTDGVLFIKLFYKQCKVFKESVLNNVFDRMRNPDEYIGMVTILASFISELSANKYQPCQGAFETPVIVKNSPLFENLQFEKQGNKIVYRTLGCHLMTQEGKTRCESCEYKPYVALIMRVLEDSKLGWLSFQELFHRACVKSPYLGQEKGRFRPKIKATLMKDVAFFKFKEGGLTFWKINTSLISKTKQAKVIKTVNSFQDKNLIGKSHDERILQKSTGTLQQKSKKIVIENKEKGREKVILRQPPSSSDQNRRSLVVNKTKHNFTLQNIKIHQEKSSSIKSKQQIIQKPIPTQAVESNLNLNPILKIDQFKKVDTDSFYQIKNPGTSVKPIPVMNINSIFDGFSVTPKSGTSRSLVPISIKTTIFDSLNTRGATNQQFHDA